MSTPRLKPSSTGNSSRSLVVLVGLLLAGLMAADLWVAFDPLSKKTPIQLASNSGETARSESPYSDQDEATTEPALEFEFSTNGLPGAASGYDRDDWGGWTDDDEDCLDTRAEVLFARSSAPVTLDDRGCRVTAGEWVDAYSGETLVSASVVDIDHVVPLYEAWSSGGAPWLPEHKAAYANDVDNLVITHRSINRSKGSRDPASWLPPDLVVRCWYADLWIRVKDRYGLVFDAAEVAALVEASRECDGVSE